LFTVAVDRDRFVAQCLDDEIRDYAPRIVTFKSKFL
jgi:hypothetical protein